MSTEDQPLRIIVMGVSGSGKSTLANSLSTALQLRMKDGDELHLPESVAKMSQLQTLQKPSADEKDVITLNIDQPVPELLEQALHALRVSTLNVLT
ncbi:MAG: hypothetical protein EB002_06280 [Betaproteobacteria bacterium]|nr:hypothetical protein [Betaproteobacteria bacterium]